jgi:ABC-2 type transport system ATP-binding protein
MHTITAEGLSKTYRLGLGGRRTVPALTDFSVSVEPGQIFGLLGPNGAGKTTFVRILLSLVRPSSGTATLLGSPLSDDSARRRVGYLPENQRYPSHLSAEQALRLFGRLASTPSETLAARIPQLLELTGLADWKSVKIKKFSKGMIQRLGLAHAMVNDPEVLFLDEPTDGLDPIGRKQVRDILTEMRGRGKTIFLNSHLLSEVEMVCDRVAILDKGRLLRVATIDELTTVGSSVEIGFEGTIPQALQDEVRATVMAISFADGKATAELTTTAELNRTIDLFRRHGVPITSVLPRKSTLEETFIKMVRKEGAQ